MPRIRSVKPEFWLDRKLAKAVSRDGRLLYIGLWNYADEHCRLHGDPAVIKGEVFPYDDDIDLDDIERLLGELAALGRIQRYEFEDDPYIFVPKLAKHQRLEPAKAKSRLPDPPPDRPGGKSPSTEAHSEKTAAESEPNAAQSEPIVAQQVAGSRLQVAGSMEQEAGSKEQVAGGSGTREARPNAAAASVFDLMDELGRAGITVDWKTDEQESIIVFEAIQRCGIPALVKNAAARYQRNNPAFSVKAFISGWENLPGPPPKLELVPDPCQHGYDHRRGCPMCRQEASA